MARSAKWNNNAEPTGATSVNTRSTVLKHIAQNTQDAADIPINQTLKTTRKQTDASLQVINPPLENVSTPPDEWSSDFWSRLLQTPLQQAAEQLGLDEEVLRYWLKRNPAIPSEIQFIAIRLMNRYALDPFLDEIDLVQFEDDTWHAMITSNGYARLINQTPQFTGLLYQSGPELEHGIPQWMECTIYRNDRAIPTTVREYYCEVHRPTKAWQTMPIRMLRNRVFQQCAKLAIGI